MLKKILLIIFLAVIAVHISGVPASAAAPTLDCTPLDQKVQGSASVNPLAVIGNIFNSLLSFVNFSAPEIETKYAKIGDPGANSQLLWNTHGRRINIIKESDYVGTITYKAQLKYSINWLVAYIPFLEDVFGDGDHQTSLTGWIFGWNADDTSPGGLSEQDVINRPTLVDHLLGFQNDAKSMEELIRLVDNTPNWFQTPQAFTMYKKAGVEQRLHLVDKAKEGQRRNELRDKDLRGVLSAWDDYLYNEKGQEEPRYDYGCGYLEKGTDGATISVAQPTPGNTSRMLYESEFACQNKNFKDANITDARKRDICTQLMGTEYGSTGVIQPNTILGKALGNDPEKLKLILTEGLAYGVGNRAFWKCKGYKVQDAALPISKEIIRKDKDQTTRKDNNKENKNKFRQPMSIPTQPSEQITEEVAKMISPAPVNAKRKEAYQFRTTQCQNAHAVVSDTASAMGAAKFSDIYQSIVPANLSGDPRVHGAFTSGPAVLGIQSETPQVLAAQSSVLGFPFDWSWPVQRDVEFKVDVPRELLNLWKNTAGPAAYTTQFIPGTTVFDVLKTPVEPNGLAVRELPSGADMRHGGSEKDANDSGYTAIPTPFGGGIDLIAHPCHGVFNESITPFGFRCAPKETARTGKILHDLTQDFRHEQKIGESIKQNLASYNQSGTTADLSRN